MLVTVEKSLVRGRRLSSAVAMLSVCGLLVVLLWFGFSATEDETSIGPFGAASRTKATRNVSAVGNGDMKILTVPAVVASTFEAITDSTTPTTEPVTSAVTVADIGSDEAEILPDIAIVSDVIFNECNCTEDMVDCSNRDLKRPFQAEDWNGLQALGLLDITVVDLSSNHFIAMPQFPALRIRSLNLSNCHIEILEDAAFSNLNYLAVLDLSRNKLSFVMGKRVFYGVLEEGKVPMPFMDLEHLSLAYNDIHSLSQDVFMFMPHLTFLDLSGNPLVSIDQVTMGALVDLIRLKELRISGCDLETLPKGMFTRLKNLQRLDISENQFSVVPKALSEAKKLLYLNFNANPIQAISKKTALSNLTKLEELHLSGLKKLKYITQGALGYLESLAKLYLSYNPRLTVLDPEFLEWEDELGAERRPLLEELYLNNNNISKIDSRLLERWDHLTRVDFTANPYICDCHNQWMIDVLVPLILRMSVNASAAKMICRKPYDYRGLTFAQLYDSHKKLPCAVSEVINVGSGMEMAMLYGVLIGMLLSFPIVMVVVILWKKGYFARCRKKMNSNRNYFDDEESDAF